MELNSLETVLIDKACIELIFLALNYLEGLSKMISECKVLRVYFILEVIESCVKLL